MKSTPQQYAMALFGALEKKGEGEQKKIFKNFLAVIKKNGDTTRLPAIVREVENQQYARIGAHKIEVTSASPLSATVKKQILGTVKHGVIARESVDASLIGGVTICVDDETLIDASIKNQLVKLFK